MLQTQRGVGKKSVVLKLEEEIQNFGDPWTVFPSLQAPGVLMCGLSRPYSFRAMHPGIGGLSHLLRFCLYTQTVFSTGIREKSKYFLLESAENMSDLREYLRNLGTGDVVHVSGILLAVTSFVCIAFAFRQVR